MQFLKDGVQTISPQFVLIWFQELKTSTLDKKYVFQQYFSQNRYAKNGGLD